MKKSLFLFGALAFASSSLNAQTLFSENFNGGSTLPAGWKQYNLDGRTPNANDFGFMGTAAWKVNAGSAEHGNILTSVSSYSPSGASNDWAVTPVIAIPAAGTYTLEYDVTSYAANPSYYEEYEIYVSTTGSTVADFTGAPLLQTTAEDSWAVKRLSLAAYAGQSVYIAFRNNSNDKYAMAIDNIAVKQFYQNDAKVSGVSLARYSQVNVNNTLKLNVSNGGSNAITALSVNWNDGTDHISTITANIAPGASAVINHPTAVAAATALEKNITITITQVNGVADADPANNTGTAKFNTLSAVVQKNVLIEEGTGTWCSYCPRGIVAMEQMYNAYPTRFIGIAVHNSAPNWPDPMLVPEYDAAVDFEIYPNFNADRVLLRQPVHINNFDAVYNSRKDLLVPAEVSGSFTASGSNVAITAKATFKTVMANANYRLAVIIVENKVKGTTSGYDQSNAFAGGANGPMGGYELLPNPVPASKMVYDHVGRALLGGYSGQAGSVPATIADGTVASHTFNYTVPATSIRANMKAVIVLVDQTTGAVINAKEIAIASVGMEEAAKTIDMQVYPNPASDVVNISFTAENKNYAVTIYDLQGRVVRTQDYASLSGTQEIQLPVNGMAPGNYMISISTEGTSYSQHVIIK